MTINKKIVQLSLVSIGIFLILVTYFLYPKFLKQEAINVGLDVVETDPSDKKRNVFENVEYKGLYGNNRPFKVKSEKAFILATEPNVVYMTTMHVSLYMEDGRIVIITSDNGSFNKISYDCFFENNVRAVDDKTTVLAENLDLLASKDTATVYNNVFLNNDKGSLRADKVYYDFEKKYYHVSMFSDEKVKIKLIK